MLFQEEENQDKLKALDELFEASAAYRTSQNFFELLKFINKFPKLSPFNAFLVHMQNRGVKLVMSPSKWLDYGRKIKYEARPLVVLIPFGPVQFVYDIADTEGKIIPHTILNPFQTTGELPVGVFDRTIRNCAKDNIIYQEDPMHKASAGLASSLKNGAFKVLVNGSYSINNKFSTLVHELGHIYAGHLGVLNESWWEPRFANEKVVEVEAEAISYLVCKRMGLQTSSESYLSNYIAENKEMPAISLDVILTVAGYIEQLGKPGFKPKKK
ncbi:MAG: hypothetical protein EOP48_19055 [Sphingobacteriales bacterium]|nr:MAG: hypothetical protein EOP48_19055 [Sphingobacteriales bacterium]